MDWSLLMLLVCPLMMVYMMFGMKGMYSSANSNQSEMDWTLHQDYAELKVQNERMKKEIQDLS